MWGATGASAVATKRGHGCIGLVVPNNALVFTALFSAPSSDTAWVISWVRKEVGQRLLNGAAVVGSPVWWR